MTKTFKLIAVGDLQLGDSPTTVGYGFFSKYSGTALETVFADVQPALERADLLFGNLETTLVPPAAGETRRDALQLRGEPQFAASLRRIGFDVLNVANNHAVQHGYDSFATTVATLREAGLACCGVRGTGGWASEPAFPHRQAGKLAVLGYCLRPRQYGSTEVPPYAEGGLDEICGDVRRLRASGVTVIVSLHWGEEFVPHPSEQEMRLARAVIDAGATAILGHHPHVVRPVERYKSGLIAYSLGNFVGDMVWYRPFRRGTLLEATLNDAHVVDASVRYTSLGSDYRPKLEDGLPDAPMNEGTLEGLSEAAYAGEIAATMRRQRAAAYLAAIVNLPRTPIAIMVQLITQTLRNKLSALAPTRGSARDGQ